LSSLVSFFDWLDAPLTRLMIMLAAAQYPNMELDEHGNGCVIPDMQADGTSPIPVQADCTFGRMPQFLVNASSTEQVAKTVQFASKHNLRFRVKNVSHCIGPRLQYPRNS
jgi:FAD/FMN-containing dehydrogenase